MSRRLATPLAFLILTALIVFTALAGGATRVEDCRGNSPKKPCPTIEPAEGATARGTVRVRATVEQARADIAGILFELDGAPLGPEDVVAPYELDWDTTKAPNGGHALTATVRLADGETSTGRNDLSVDNPTPDTTPPSAQLTTPGSGSTVSGTVDVAANASDNVGVVGVQFKLDGANLGAEDTTAPYGVSWSTTTTTNAQHTLTAVARDAAGNKTTTAARTVTVNNTTTVPSSGSLRWPAPALTSPQTILIPERGGEQWTLEAGKDYIVKFQTGRRYGPMRFAGGRNLVFVGGEQIIDDTTSTDYGKRRLLEFRDQTGTIHIEGYLGRGPGLTEGINIWAPNAILQIQKSRIENLHKMSNNTAQHPDLIQTWSGPKEVRIWRFTGYTDYQGFLFMKASGGVYPGKVTFEDVNVRPLPNPAWGGKGYGIAALWMLSASTEYRLGGVWVETGWWNGTVHNGLKSSLGFRDPSLTSPLWSWQEFRANGTAYGPEYIAQPGNTGTSLANQQGDWIEFVRPSTDNIWNLAGTGRTRVYGGIPSGGDFVSASSVGTGYTP